MNCMITTAQAWLEVLSLRILFYLLCVPIFLIKDMGVGLLILLRLELQNNSTLKTTVCFNLESSCADRVKLLTVSLGYQGVRPVEQTPVIQRAPEGGLGMFRGWGL